MIGRPSVELIKIQMNEPMNEWVSQRDMYIFKTLFIGLLFR